MLFSPASYLLLLRPNYLPQHPVVEHSKLPPLMSENCVESSRLLGL
jgi:hypothetical protein